MFVFALVVAQNAGACGGDDHGWCGDDEDEDDDAPDASIDDGDESEGGETDVALAYAMQFFPERPAHYMGLRIKSDDDSYVAGELRYMPCSDLVAVGRAGAGFDVFGRGKFDLTLGMWIGAAGEWDDQQDVAILYATPTIGTELGIGFDGRHFFSKYRWIAGIGGGPIDEMMTETEFTFGYKIAKGFHVYGEYVVIGAGELPNEEGAGMGAKVVF